MIAMKLLVVMFIGMTAMLTEGGVHKMSISKHMPSYSEVMIRRMTRQPAPPKYGGVLKKGTTNFLSYVDNFYMSAIAAGSTKKFFQIILDTGSANLWLVDASCTATICNGIENPSIGLKWNKNKYDRTKSTTYKKDGRPWTIQYGSGNAEGDLVIDDVTFAGITAKGLTFGAAKQIAQVFAYFPMDGIFGLAFQSLAVDNVEPPVQHVADQLDKKLFTVWLDRHVKPAKGEVGGLITFGDLDTDNCDAEITYVPLSSATYWEFPLTGFAYGKYNKDKAYQAISDTGTSFILGPTADVQAVIKASGASYDFQTGLYTIDCSKAKSLPPVIFKIKGRDLAIPANEHIVDLNLPGGKCALGFDVGFGFSFDWLLGDAHIRSWCTVYDFGNKRIGFSKAHHKEV